MALWHLFYFGSWDIYVWVFESTKMRVKLKDMYINFFKSAKDYNQNILCQIIHCAASPRSLRLMSHPSVGHPSMKPFWYMISHILQDLAAGTVLCSYHFWKSKVLSWDSLDRIRLFVKESTIHATLLWNMFKMTNLMN